MEVDPKKVENFETSGQFADWLKRHHADEKEVWLKIFKTSSNSASITWTEAVIEAIAWGWIDGLKKSNDEESYFQRFTPRATSSGWSKRNCKHAEALIESGRMEKPGRREVEAAKSDGRWDAAYAGSAEMEIPEDFLEELSRNKKAEKFYKTLNRTNLYSIYHRLKTAKKEETRQNRMSKIIDMLSRGETFH